MSLHDPSYWDPSEPRSHSRHLPISWSQGGLVFSGAIVERLILERYVAARAHRVRRPHKAVILETNTLPTHSDGVAVKTGDLQLRPPVWGGGSLGW